WCVWTVGRDIFAGRPAPGGGGRPNLPSANTTPAYRAFPANNARSANDIGILGIGGSISHGNVPRSMYQTLSGVRSRGGAVSLLTVPGLITCTDARLFDASSCTWTPILTFYTSLEIER